MTHTHLPSTPPQHLTHVPTSHSHVSPAPFPTRGVQVRSGGGLQNLGTSCHNGGNEGSATPQGPLKLPPQPHSASVRWRVWAPGHREVENPEAGVRLSPKPSQLGAGCEAPFSFPQPGWTSQPLPRCDPRPSQPRGAYGAPNGVSVGTL